MFIRVIRIKEKTLLRLINSAQAGLFFLCFILDNGLTELEGCDFEYLLEIFDSRDIIKTDDH